MPDYNILKSLEVFSTVYPLSVIIDLFTFAVFANGWFAESSCSRFANGLI